MYVYVKYIYMYKLGYTFVNKISILYKLCTPVGEIFNFICFVSFADNYYGTPKPPAEPAPLLLNVTDQILPGATPSTEGKRKRNKSVSNMEKASIEPPEEEEEERPVVNGNGVVVTPG